MGDALAHHDADLRISGVSLLLSFRTMLDRQRARGLDAEAGALAVINDGMLGRRFKTLFLLLEKLPNGAVTAHPSSYIGGGVVCRQLQVSVDQHIACFRQLIACAQAPGLKIIGAMPTFLRINEFTAWRLASPTALKYPPHMS